MKIRGEKMNKEEHGKNCLENWSKRVRKGIVFEVTKQAIVWN